VLGVQLRVSTREIDPYQTPLDLLRLLPLPLAVKFSIYPVELPPGGRLLVAANQALSREQLDELEQALERPVEMCLSTRTDIAFAIRRGYDRLQDADEKTARKSRLGFLLLENKLVTSEQLTEALKVQRQSFFRLGDHLVEQGVISLESLERAIQRYSPAAHGRLGDFLVLNNYISSEQLEEALSIQESRFQPLGDVLLKLNMISPADLESVREPVDA
jgi:bacteriophage N4 adsorption protein B